MSLTDEQLRFLITPEQEEDHRMRWVALQQQTPAQTLERPEWLDAWMTPMGDYPGDCGHSGGGCYVVCRL